MKLGEIYRKIVDMGIEADPRGKERVDRVLEKSKKTLEGLKGKKREFADEDVTWNPYTDCRLLYGEEDLEIGSVLSGVDITPGEIALADIMESKGKKIDLVLAHHPHGIGTSNLDFVMKLQPEQWADIGVPIAQAESAMAPRLKEVHFATKARNHTQTIDAARFIDIPFMCAHTPADSIGYQFLTNYLEKENPDSLDDLLEVLLEIPEYQSAEKVGAGPEILVGNKSGSVGKKMVFFTGGTSANPRSLEIIARAGVSTIITMHMGDNMKKQAEKEGLYVVIAGHDSSDSIGMNIVLDELEKNGLKTYTCSGHFRHKRI